MADGRPDRRLEGHTMPITDVAVAADGSAIVTASRDATVRYWPL